MDTNYWTIAYRRSLKSNRFLRVGGLALSWDAATELANDFAEAMPGYQVFYVPNATYDAAHPSEDSFNILVDSGRRVKIKEGGVLPEGVTDPSVGSEPTPVEPTVETVEIVLPARFAEVIEGTNLIQNPETDGDPFTDEVIKAWTNATVRRKQIVLTVPADQHGTNVLDWLYDYAYGISFGAGFYDRAEKSAALTVRNRISNAKYAIYKIRTAVRP